MQWDWQSSVNGSNWSAVANSAGKDTLIQTYSGNISYRLRIICLNTNDTAYSNVVHIGDKESYKCYCYSIATGNDKDTSDVGLFKFGSYEFGGPGPHLNNTTAVNGRTDNTDTTLVLYTDSTYEASVTHILRSSKHADAKVTLFIDYNNNLKYDASELVWTGKTTANTPTITKSIKIPSDAVTGKPTGMRLIINNNTDPNVPSDEGCGAYVSGETEDYVVLFHKKGTGIASVPTINDLKVYPNPSDGKVNIRYFGAAQEKATVTVMSVDGRTLKKMDISNVANGQVMELDLSAFAQGTYFIRFTTSNDYVIRKLTLMNNHR